MTQKNELSTRFIDAFKELLNRKEIKDRKEFASVIEVSPSMITEIEKGRSNVGTTAIQNIVSRFNISAEWLLTGKGEMLKTGGLSPIGEQEREKEPKIKILHNPKTKENNLQQQAIKLYDVAAAANLKTLFANKDQNILGEIMIPDIPRCDGAVYVNGDSMYPLLKSGDIIAYKEIYNLEYVIFGEMYLVSFNLQGDDYLAVKYINLADRDSFVKLVSYNSHHDPMEIPVASINALGLVKFSIRKNTMI